MPSYQLYLSVSFVEPVDSLSVSLTAPSGIEHPVLNAQLDGPSWGTSGYSHTFSVEEIGDWSLAVTGTLNGQPMSEAPAGYYNPEPSASKAEPRWRIQQKRFAAGYLVLSAMCAVSCGLMLFFIGMIRNVSKSALGQRAQLHAATLRHHEAVRSAGVTS